MIFENAIIIKATAGFYYVKTLDGNILECKARGVFRKQGLSPLVGDRVTAEIDGDRGTVTDIYERKNSFLRPPVANVDKLIIVSSTVEPRPNLLLIDRLTAIAVSKNVEPVVIFSKTDLAPCDEYCEIYEKAGIKCIPFSSETNEGADEVKKLFENSVCALTGNTGVGKSSLLNAIAPDLSIETSHISKKLGRGRHTTRTVELYELFGGYIADTPGFSSLDFENGELIKKEELPYCFPEFADYIGYCKFVSCAHVCEKGCKICEAVENGIIHTSRHDSYKALYNEVKDYKEWEHRK